MYDEKYFDDKWTKVIKLLPNGGDYHFDLREPGMQQVADAIEGGSKVFDFACGLSLISKRLVNKGCTVAGCDFSKVAADFAKQNTGGDFRQYKDFFGGPYDYVIAVYFLEHISNPCAWLRDALDQAPKVICVIPNNFNKTGEHLDMQWGSWGDFERLFTGFKWRRIDDYSAWPRLAPAFKHPIVLFERAEEKKKDDIKEMLIKPMVAFAKKEDIQTVTVVTSKGTTDVPIPTKKKRGRPKKVVSE